MDRSASTSKYSGKLVHLVLSLEAGGLERLVCNLASRPELAEFEMVVCCLDEFGWLKTELEQMGGRMVLVKRKPGFDPVLIWRLARLFRRERVTVLHTHSLDPFFYGGLAARLAGVPTIIHTQHDPLPASYGWKDRWKFRVASKVCDRIVAVSAQTSQALSTYDLPEGRAITILNGIDEGRFRSEPNQAALRPSSAEWRIGTVARLSPEKGIRVLLEAFAQLHAKYPASRLVLAGDGPQRTELEEYAEELQVRNSCDFMGVTQHVAQMLQSLDVFVLPSLSEGIPLALLEAMAAHCAIVATNVGGIPEVIVHQESGLLIPPRDPGRMCDAVAGLLESPLRRAALGFEAAKRVRACFSESAMAEAYRCLYHAKPRTSLWKHLLKRTFRRILPRRWLIWAGRSGRLQVAVTFDDGPDPIYTPQLLDILRQYRTKATFFVIGEKLRSNEAIVHQLLAEGHELGNHSYSHPHFEQLSWRQAASEISATQDAIKLLHGTRCNLFRPPRGKLCLRSILAAWLNALTVVLWTVDLKDYRAQRPSEITRAIDTQPISPGDIILYHGHNAAAVEALPHILKSVIDSGCRAVCVSELLAS